MNANELPATARRAISAPAARSASTLASGGSKRMPSSRSGSASSSAKNTKSAKK
jgi:hypothetical protein